MMLEPLAAAFTLFDAWLAEAQTSEPNDPNAMALATVGADGQPSSRMVLLKGHGPDGFVFYTNSHSRKGGELGGAAGGGSAAALLFHWKSLRRQIRIEGAVSPVDAATADAYFASRGRDSQLGAWASEQSAPLADRPTFLAAFAAVEARFAGQDVQRPPHWLGYSVAPARIEFWQDGAHRLHERTLYTRSGNGWTTQLLYP